MFVSAEFVVPKCFGGSKPPLLVTESDHKNPFACKSLEQWVVSWGMIHLSGSVNQQSSYLEFSM